MNLLLLLDEDFLPDGTARLTGRRAQHAREVLRAEPGESLRVGHLGGLTGTGEVLENSAGVLHLRVALTEPPPPRAGVDLLLAIPRPKALKKVLPAVASLGVDRIVLVNAARVEKSYFDSKVLDPAFVHELLIQGLEQARDTRIPEVLVRERFRPFVEDELDSFFGPRTLRLLPHPPARQPLRALGVGLAQRVVLAIGPDGGWVPFEADLLEAHGFHPFSLGPRILRVETAVPVLLGQVALLREDIAAPPATTLT
ncbi:16S rRNA (uracil(1498)-N(3))-methyltransferase [Myxococcus xanthus]|uniref:Ribosomal RNA small subunit methyltransferase E n=1 Tax=Myxococcus xanthus TaxID=34 RepID=A0AAE6FXY7_MYXXA|nr:16S rRNA (uracil(1498)-N(3))-methyltransferase [Myxococcus xanthus]QDE67232.1 16S rRNA (uracil(1498)-N(3))-methyltransferase [Myxococcus xanthus]QDE74507.1 16S rRNA (uracil(1498)-N(3))-methyltransferase [Myxococcus xanthus]QDF03543.1 16S rRNA (uracil(1498)-N(3))-methyltransferase [Myxococcus xanthus]